MIQRFLLEKFIPTSAHRVVNVDDVVFPGPGVGVAPYTVQVVVLVHGGQHRPMQLEGAEHGGTAGAALQRKHSIIIRDGLNNF